MEIRCVYTEGNQNVIQEAVDRLPSAGGTVIVPRGQLEKRCNSSEKQCETVSGRGMRDSFQFLHGGLPSAGIYTLGRRGMLQLFAAYLRGRL